MALDEKIYFSEITVCLRQLFLDISETKNLSLLLKNQNIDILLQCPIYTCISEFRALILNDLYIALS